MSYSASAFDDDPRFGAPRFGAFLQGTALPPPTRDLFAPPAAAPSTPTWIGGGLAAGFNELQSLGGSAVQAGGKLLGSEGIERWGRETAEKNAREAQAAGRPDLETPFWRDGGTSNIPAWLTYQAAKQVPQVAGGLLAAALVPEAVVPAGLARLGAVAPRVLGGGGLSAGATALEAEAAAVAGQQFAKGAIGAAAAAYPPAVGSLYQSATDREAAGGGAATRNDALGAFLAGVPYAALDSIEVPQLRRFASAAVEKGVLRSAGHAALAGGLTEMPTEAAQTAMEMAFRPDLSAGQKAQNVVDAALTGAAVGGVFGGGAGAIGGLRRVRQADPTTLTDGDLATAVDETLGQGTLPGIEARPDPAAMLARHGQVLQPASDAPEPALNPTPAPGFAPAPARPFAEQSEEDLAGVLGAVQRKLLDNQPVTPQLSNLADLARQELERRAADAPTIAPSVAPAGQAPLFSEEQLAPRPFARMGEEEVVGFAQELEQRLAAGRGTRQDDLDLGLARQELDRRTQGEAAYSPATQGELFTPEQRAQPERDRSGPAALTAPVAPEPPPADIQATRKLAESINGRATQFTRKLEAADEAGFADQVLSRIEAGKPSEEILRYGQHFGFVGPKGESRDLGAELATAQQGLMQAARLAPVQGVAAVREAEAQVSGVKALMALHDTVAERRDARAAETRAILGQAPQPEAAPAQSELALTLSQPGGVRAQAPAPAAPEAAAVAPTVAPAALAPVGTGAVDPAAPPALLQQTWDVQHRSSNLDSLTNGFEQRDLGISFARKGRERPYSSPTVGDMGGRAGVLDAQVSGNGLDYENPEHKAFIESLWDDKTSDVDVLNKLRALGVDWVSGYNGIGASNELHVLNPKAVQVLNTTPDAPAVAPAPATDGPLADWQQANTAAMAGFLARAPALGERISALHAEGKTATEIATALGAHWTAPEVREARNLLGLQPHGPMEGLLAPAVVPTDAPAAPAPPSNEIVSGARLVEGMRANQQSWDASLGQTRMDLDGTIAQALKQHGRVQVTMPDGTTGLITGRWRRQWADAKGKQFPTTEMLPSNPEEAARLSIVPAPEGEPPALAQGTTPEDEPLSDVQARPGANVLRLSNMLGPQLYGDMSQLGDVSLKEMYQNSFDAVKAVLQKTPGSRGKIDIGINDAARTITVTDTGNGMTPEILNKAFLTLAGTHKETDRSSGGFGIAKMAFLFGSEKLQVTTVRDGIESRLETTGPQLMAAMEDPSQAPQITRRRTAASNGTQVTVTVPKTYHDPSRGVDRDIAMPGGRWLPESLQHSPLFENIDVAVDGEPLPVGANFPHDEYTHFADVKFAWGNARVVVTKAETTRESKNVKVLSNGLYQFDTKISKVPGDSWSGAIPRMFYVNVEPAVRPDEPGYPFELSRQGFSRTANADFQKIFNYLWVMYRGSEVAETANGFGVMEYVGPDGRPTGRTKLAPEMPTDDLQMTINAGDQIEVVDGRLIVNGREVPVLTPEDLEKARVDLSKFTVDQDQINPNMPFLHSNMLVPAEGGNGAPTPITEAAQAKFGRRFGQFMHELGQLFIDLRDVVSDFPLPSKSFKPNLADISKIGVGISFDKGYHGVHITVPFRAVMLNPAALPEGSARRQGIELYATMVHELAHFREMNHSGAFWQEDHNLRAELEMRDLDTEWKNRLSALTEANADILGYLRERNNDPDVKAGAESFQDGQRQATRPNGDVGAAGGPAGRADQTTAQGNARAEAGPGNPGGQQRGAGADPGRPQAAGQGADGQRLPGGDGRLGDVATPQGMAEQVKPIADFASKALNALPRRVDLGAKATRAELYLATIVHIAERFGRLLPSMRGYVDALRDRTTTHERFSRLFSAVHAPVERLAKSDPKGAELVQSLMRATEFEVDPRKSWDQHTWLHGSTNEANLRQVVARANEDYRRLRQKQQGKVYDDLVAVNEALQNAMMSVSLYNLVGTEPQAAAAGLEGFARDPVDAFRARSSLAESAGAARDYWQKTLAAQVQAVQGFLASTPGSGALAARLQSIEQSLAGMAQAPYFHLGRAGDHFVAFEMRAGADGKAVDPAAQRHVAQALAAAGFSDIQMSRESDRPGAFVRLANKSQMESLAALARKLQQQGWLSPKKVIRGNRSDPEARGLIRPEWLDQMIQRLQADASLEPAEGMDEAQRTTMARAKAQAIASLREAYLDMLPDTALSKVMVQREAVPGYARDMMRNYAFRMNVGITALANLSAAGKVTSAFSGMRSEIKVAMADPKQDPARMGDVLAELARREAERPLRPQTGFLDMLRAFNHAYFLGASPAYAIVNATQIGTLLWPELARKAGFVGAGKAIAKVTPTALKVVSAMLKEGFGLGLQRAADAVITESVLRDAGIPPATADFLIRAVNRTNIDVGGASRELGRVADPTMDGKTELALRYAGAIGFYSETLTRLVAALAAREVHGGGAGAEVDAYADRVVEQSMLNYQTWNVGRAFGKGGMAGPLTPVFTAFQQYSFQTMEKLYRELGTAFGATAQNAQEAREARKFLGAHLTAMTVMAGTLGLPFAAVAARVLEALVDTFDDDDQPYDVKSAWRNFLSGMFGKDVGEVLAHGGFRATGVDVASRVGEAELLPFSRFLADRRKLEDRLQDLANESAGAPWSMVSNIALGFRDLADGKVMPGLLKMLPTALRAPTQAWQMAERGYTNKSGQVLPMSAGANDILAQALGFKPAEKGEYDEAYLAQAVRRGVLTGNASTLRGALTGAIEGRDPAALRGALPATLAFDAHNPSYAVLPTLSQALTQRALARGRGEATGLPIGTSLRDPGALGLTNYANY